jgi:hypothetical protein
MLTEPSTAMTTSARPDDGTTLSDFTSPLGSPGVAARATVARAQNSAIAVTPTSVQTRLIATSLL